MKLPSQPTRRRQSPELTKTISRLGVCLIASPLYGRRPSCQHSHSRPNRFGWLGRIAFKMEQSYGSFWCTVSDMRMTHLTAKQLLAVRCPACGVAPGERCLLHSGAPCPDVHLDRKLSAAEAIETRRIPRDLGRRQINKSTSDQQSAARQSELSQ